MRLPDPDPGTVERDWLEVTTLPTGDAERLPVAVVEGDRPGPTAWVTGGVHGDEATGIAAAQDVVRAFVGDGDEDGDGDAVGTDGDDLLGGAANPDGLRGRIVCVPVVNPAGLRRSARRSYYHGEDPNRAFPDPTGESVLATTVQELIAERLYEAFSEATFLLDLHTAQVHSVPFVIRHRALHGTVRTREEAETLSGRVERLVEALGLPVVRQYPVAEYVDRGLHRSAVGAAQNAAGIPACTVELGGHSTVDDNKRATGVAAVFRALAAFDMLGSVPERIAAADPGFVSPIDFATRRHRGPRTDVGGVVRHRVEPGDVFEAGEPVADVTSATGELLTTLRSDHDGYVLGHRTGVAVYENSSVAALAVRDDAPLVGERP